MSQFGIVPRIAHFVIRNSSFVINPSGFAEVESSWAEIARDSAEPKFVMIQFAFRQAKYIFKELTYTVYMEACRIFADYQPQKGMDSNEGNINTMREEELFGQKV